MGWGEEDGRNGTEEEERGLEEKKRTEEERRRNRGRTEESIEEEREIGKNRR